MSENNDNSFEMYVGFMIIVVFIIFTFLLGTGVPNNAVSTSKGVIINFTIVEKYNNTYTDCHLLITENEDIIYIDNDHEILFNNYFIIGNTYKILVKSYNMGPNQYYEFGEILYD